MAADRKHEAWLRFARSVLDVTINRSKDDLFRFREVAVHEHSALVPIIDEYIRLSINADTDVKDRGAGSARKRGSSAKQMHLFDLLREKTFFPQNLDLARFAGRVLPDLRTYRFDKMSRSDIAARIIEFIEASDPKTKEALEKSMREALEDMSGRPTKEVERRSFLSKWEGIIKGVEAAE